MQVRALRKKLEKVKALESQRDGGKVRCPRMRVRERGLHKRGIALGAERRAACSAKLKDDSGALTEGARIS